ncbi:hypothetical protein NE237_007090 [Protea cynaroides]|uniref:NADP-dependent oxidoreductase domain-containing protein n=1 Tax=Protea cynaroides TaxID=273540 RepID=A0A9Q0KNS8_9MAGN|nr:hypothetical protein NE237_007090 [Protea cynaroides]
MSPEIVLSSGQRMPLIGMGTACKPIPPNLTSTLVHAIELGYRHIDTAPTYNTEEFVCHAVAQEVWARLCGPLSSALAYNVETRKSQPHFSQGEEILPFDMRGTWEAMEECCKLGLAKSIGGSNFSIKKLSQHLTYAIIPPAVNQESIPSDNRFMLEAFIKSVS